MLIRHHFKKVLIMEFRQLKYFVAAAQSQNFRKAAESCLVAQSALSRQIAALEVELGVELFRRIDRRVVLTPAGKEFATYARAILEQIQQGEQAMAELKLGERGLLNIGCVEALAASFLPSVFSQFHQLYPLVRLRVSVKGADELMREVEEGQLDFGLIFDPPMRPDSLIIKELFRQPLHLISSIIHPLVQNYITSVTLEQAAQEPQVVLREGYGIRRIIERLFAARSLTINKLIEIDSIEGMKEFVKQGVGVALMPTALLRPSQIDREIKIFPITDVAEEFTFGLVYRRFGSISKPARELIQIITQASA